MRLASKEEAERIIERVNQWWNSQDLHMFHDCQTITRRSVSEFLANEEGLTLFKSVADRSK